MLYKARNSVTEFYNNYSSMLLRAKNKAKNKAAKEQEAPGIKISTPKQMLQRFPIALTKVKAGNNSESLLNEIRQTVRSLYHSKKNYKRSIQ